MSSHFFAYLARMKLINRWSLMRNTLGENIQEHSLQVALIAHAMALIGNKYYKKQYDANKIAVIALFHDVSEVITGDLPTPVKYFNYQIRDNYHEVERMAQDKLLSLLPGDLQDDYRSLLTPSEDESYFLVKAADKIAAYTKCLEEEMAGNREFSQAQKTIAREMEKYRILPEVDYFWREFVASFSLTLDDMSFDNK
ncbi:MAG: 5'-deoxynucleotidase [Clostridiales bacterium]